MAKAAMARARIEPGLKNRAKRVFGKLLCEWSYG